MRGFLPWRLSDAGRPNVPRRQSCGRHPKPFTKPEAVTGRLDVRFTEKQTSVARSSSFCAKSR
jgi:hypothetical protein